MQTTRVATHYDANYFKWQNGGGKVGGSLTAQIFLPFIGANDAVLDFGCGGGWVLSSISANCKLGVDINSSARDFARSIGVDTISSLDQAEDGAFDVVISHHALEHTEAPLDVVRKISTKLKPKGLAVFVVPCERYDTQYQENNTDQHLYTWSPMNLGNLFRYAGFDIISVERIAHRWPPRIDLIDKLLGRMLCNLLCRLHAIARPKLTQVRVVAQRP